MFKRKTWTCSSSLCSTDYLLISFFFSFPAHKILFTHFSLRFWLFSIYHLMATKCLNFCGHACSCLFWTLQIAEVGSALRLYIQWRARHLKAHGSAVLLLMQVKVGWYNFKPYSLLKCLSLCISSILLLITSLLPYILFIYIFFNSRSYHLQACGTSSGISVWSLLSNECIFNLDCHAPVQDLLFDKNQVSIHLHHIKTGIQ